MITAEMVRELREKTGAGMMDCKKALSESDGDTQKATDILRQKGLASASKKSGRQASEGLVASYIHMDKIGVLIEVNCETDFVARTDDFRGLVKDLSMQVAAANPAYIRREDVPPDVIEREKAVYRAQVEGKPPHVAEKIVERIVRFCCKFFRVGKPPHVAEKIVEGKLEKFFGEVCLLEQVFVKDPAQKQKVGDLITGHIAKLGENIVLRRFARFQLGES